MKHLFGIVLTDYGIAANNCGQNEGNLSTLQKIFWKDEVHTSVSAEAIRWSLRRNLQIKGYSVNREWNADIGDFCQKSFDYDSEAYVDDDILGYMRAEAAKVDGSDQHEQTPKTKSNKSKQSQKKTKGECIARRGALEVARAISINPFVGDNAFSARSGREKDRTSIHSTEVHATRYQYGFALTPNHLKDKSRTLAVLDCLLSLNGVGGNHARFLYDFSPASIVLRWTDDFAPRFLHSFEEDEDGNISIQSLIQKISSGDVNPEELWAGGICHQALAEWGVNSFSGVKAAVNAIKTVIAKDLGVSL